MIIVTYVDSYYGFRAFIIERNKAVVDSRLRFASDVESHAELYKLLP